jgi:hypothetical protein
MIDRGLSEEYVAWWLEHASPQASYDQATHAETHLRHTGSLGRRYKGSLFDLYDFFRSRYSEPLAAEAFRRALTALATPMSASQHEQRLQQRRS